MHFCYVGNYRSQRKTTCKLHFYFSSLFVQYLYNIAYLRTDPFRDCTCLCVTVAKKLISHYIIFTTLHPHQ